MGPIGGISYSRTTEWDEMGHNEISHIIVTYNKNGVRSIQFGYVDNGAMVMSKMYGSSPVGYVDNESLAMSKMFGSSSSSSVGYSTRIVSLMIMARLLLHLCYIFV